MGFRKTHAGLNHKALAACVVFTGCLLVPASIGSQLQPTVHAPLPAHATDLWLVPSADDRSARSVSTYKPLVEGIERYHAGSHADALALLTRPALASTALADYATYYTGLTQLRLARAAEARQTFQALAARKPQGYLAGGAMLGAGEAAEAAGDHRGAVAIYERLAADKLTINEDVLSRLGRAALAAGDRKRAAEAYLRVYYEFPLTDAATAAAAQLSSLEEQIVRTGYKADLGRAQMLYGARRYAEARAAFQDLQRHATGDDKEVVDLRVAESDFFLRRYEAARSGVRPYLEGASRVAEARFFDLSAVRELGDRDRYIELTRALVRDFPDSSWSEEALNNLGTYYIVQNEDDLAAQAFRELYEKFPSGQRAERAAWKYGWWAYKHGDYNETVRVFESAAVSFARSDYRPSFLYWAARSHAKLGAGTQADARMRLVHTDYANSYYGRLAERQLARRASTAPPHGVAPAAQEIPLPDTRKPPTDAVIRLLLANGLYDDALNELRYAQRAWGSSTAIDATIAWAYHRKGELRRAISLMRRTYPQFLTTGGQQLPTEILQVIFPLTYWDSIRRHATARGLDPYVMAALIAQESTFDPNARSVANAWGLMQIVPATGRRLARSLGIRGFTTASLTNPETNIRLGMLHFSRLVQQFGGTHYALASYNAGESRIVRWKAERPGLDEDEFIDDIPFPETQNYVKRILGTAEDYRRLYGEGDGEPMSLVRSAGSTRPAPAAVKAPAKKKKAPASRTTKKPTRKSASRR
jgi:soluble lytic murein transglycosylase